MDAVLYGSGALFTAVLHPIGYAKVLIQIGHEPLEPYMSKTIWGRDQLYYPSIFKYISHIKQRDGFFGLYRGLTPKLIGGWVGNVVTKTSGDFLKKKFPESDASPSDSEDIATFFMKFSINVSQEVAARNLALVCCQPFQVIAIRSMAQFVGEETYYSSIFSAISEIYQQEGFLGFFSGIVPRLIGETITIFIIHLITELLNKFVVQDKEYKSYVSFTCSQLVTTFTYPFNLVSTIMTVNGSRLAAADSTHMLYYPHWSNCWTHLQKLGQLKRGASVLWRPVKDPFIRRPIQPLFTSR